MPNETNRAMSSTSNSEGNKKEEKGKCKVQPSLGHFNFTNIKKVKGKIYTRPIELGTRMENHVCEACGICYNTSQGLGSHKLHCDMYQSKIRREQINDINKNKRMEDCAKVFTTP